MHPCHTALRILIALALAMALASTKSTKDAASTCAAARLHSFISHHCLCFHAAGRRSGYIASATPRTCQAPLHGSEHLGLPLPAFFLDGSSEPVSFQNSPANPPTPTSKSLSRPHPYLIPSIVALGVLLGSLNHSLPYTGSALNTRGFQTRSSFPPSKCHVGRKKGEKMGAQSVQWLPNLQVCSACLPQPLYSTH